MKPGLYFKDRHRKSFIDILYESDGTIMGQLYLNYKKPNYDAQGGITFIEVVKVLVDTRPKVYITNMHLFEPYDEKLVRCSGDWPYSNKHRHFKLPQNDPRIYRTHVAQGNYGPTSS